MRKFFLQDAEDNYEGDYNTYQEAKEALIIKYMTSQMLDIAKFMSVEDFKETVRADFKTAYESGYIEDFMEIHSTGDKEDK